MAHSRRKKLFIPPAKTPAAARSCVYNSILASAARNRISPAHAMPKAASYQVGQIWHEAEREWLEGERLKGLS